ncbi:MAG TPA: hypothetical protein VHY21_00635 [Pseudonocardiaceae bacterium]|jgi:hypothetical protein|nr:hypothetical protein [Pseudonocardiaceae bacterium]
MIPYQRKRSRARRGNGYVLLDSTGAKRLGVRRTSGLHRIGRRDLADRLAAQQDHSHVVGFYEIEAFLVDSVRDFLAPGLHAGAAAIVVATASHRERFDRALVAAGIDLPAAYLRPSDAAGTSHSTPPTRCRDSRWSPCPTGRALKPPFATDASTEQFRKICEQHSRVIPVPGAPAPALTEQGERR